MPFLGSTFALSAASFVLGAFLCAVYDVFRIFRLRREFNSAVLFVSDVVYSLIASLSFLILYFNFTYGRVRVYAFVISLLGFLAWRFTVSRFVISLVMRLVDFSLRALNSSKMRVFALLKRVSRCVYTAFYCRDTVKKSRCGFRKGSLK